jgi:hypothetical protein
LVEPLVRDRVEPPRRGNAGPFIDFTSCVGVCLGSAARAEYNLPFRRHTNARRGAACPRAGHAKMFPGGGASVVDFSLGYPSPWGGRPMDRGTPVHGQASPWTWVPRFMGRHSHGLRHPSPRSSLPVDWVLSVGLTFCPTVCLPVCEILKLRASLLSLQVLCRVTGRSGHNEWFEECFQSMWLTSPTLGCWQVNQK